MLAIPLAVGLLAAGACDRTGPTLPKGTPSAAKSNSAAAVVENAQDIDLVEMDLTRLGTMMTRGKLSSHALTRAYLDRIAAIDDAGPTLNAVVELNPRALEEARSRDAERQAGRVRGPLHGMPVLLKDNIDATPMVNSAGSLALEAHRPRSDAFLVAKLRNAGAVILGKTNLSEWANFRSAHSTSGWSARGGLTKNPYVLDRSACGSSSGTASAIAASLAVVGVGTETDGSIICPASVNGLVGLKPTVGLISRNGIIPLSSSQDTAGPMARKAIRLYEKSTAFAPADPLVARNMLGIVTLRQGKYGELAKAYNALPEADRAAAEPSAGVKAAKEALNAEADALIEAAAGFVAYGRSKGLPPATVDRVNQLLETVYKGRFPEDATLEGLKKILADKGAPAA